MHCLDRYISRHIFYWTLIVTLVFMGVEFFMTFVSQLTDIGVGHYTWLNALLFVPLSVPTLLVQLFPVTAFLGCLLGLGRLASQSELIVMQASGLSRGRIILAVFMAAVIMVAIMTVIGEGIAPMLNQQANDLKLRAMGYRHERSPTYLANGAWLRKQNTIYYIQHIYSAQRIGVISAFQFMMQPQQSPVLKQLSYAWLGHLIDPAANRWHLTAVAKTVLTSAGTETQAHPDGQFRLLIKPQLLQQTRRNPDQASIAQLIRDKRYREVAGLSTAQYALAIWQRLVQPVTTLVMVLLGVPFIFGSLRQMSMSTRILIGVIVGFGFYMLNQFFAPLTVVYHLSPILAAILPTIVFILITAVLMWRRQCY